MAQHQDLTPDARTLSTIIAQKALRTAQGISTARPGYVFIPNKGEDGMLDGTGTWIGSGDIGNGGVAQWIGDTTPPGKPTGVSVDSAWGTVYASWDGTLEGGVPADFAYVSVSIDGAPIGNLVEAGSLTASGYPDQQQITVSFTAYDAARDRNGNLAPNASDPATVQHTVSNAKEQIDADVEQARQDAEDAKAEVDAASEKADAAAAKADAAAAKADGYQQQIDDVTTTVNGVAQDVAGYTAQIEGAVSDASAALSAATTAQADIDGFKTTVSQTYETKADADAAIEQEALDRNSAIEQSASSILSQVSETYVDKATGETYATKAEVEQTAESITQTVSETYQEKGDYVTADEADEAYQPKGDYATQTQLTQTSDSILSEVSSSYQPKGDYATSGELDAAIAQEVLDRNSAIEQTADSITATVSQTYTTKAEASAIEGKADAAQTAASSANSAASAAQSTANAAKDDLDSFKGAVSTTYATKSSLTQTADSIRSEVSETYVAKTDADSDYQPKGDYVTDAEASSTYATKASVTAVEQDVDSLTSTVSSNYTTLNNKFGSYYTKTEVDQKDSSITLKAESAQSTANAAQTAASNAQSTANTANSTANTAKNNAATAQTTANTAQANTQKLAGLNYNQAKMLHTDPYFAKGTNDCKVYNNSSNGNVTITRESVPGSSDPFKVSDYRLRIENKGTANPGCGGFYFGDSTRANAVFLYRIWANIPSGRKIVWASNGIGSGGAQRWLTDVTGDGTFKEYVCMVECGNSGTFSSTGFFYIDGAVGTSSSPVTWYVAYATSFDLTTQSDMAALQVSVDGIESRVQSAEGNISTVTQTANSLEVRLTQAEKDVDAAQSTANTANSTANTAKSTADSASKTASAASTNATNALNTANTANTNANTAKTNAQTALNTANTAKSAADTANTNANTAKTNASTALSTANTANSTASTANTNATNALNRVTVRDTRNDNQNPQWYMTNYPKQQVQEFKYCSKIGLSGVGTYCYLTTYVPWTDNSGGYPKQTAKVDSIGKEYWRSGTSNTAWSAWVDAYGTASTANSTANTANTTANAAKTAAANAQTAANNAQTTANTANTNATNAAKTATNYLKFDSSGLVVGNHTGTLQGNTQITSTGVNIRNGSTTLATFSASKIELGKNSSTAAIKFCNGQGTIQGLSSSTSTLKIMATNSLTVQSGAAFILNASTAFAVNFGESNFGGSGNALSMGNGNVMMYGNPVVVCDRVYNNSTGATSVGGVSLDPYEYAMVTIKSAQGNFTTVLVPQNATECFVTFGTTSGTTWIVFGTVAHSGTTVTITSQLNMPVSAFKFGTGANNIDTRIVKVDVLRPLI